MKNDYLWDKTGSDQEIEKLEKALQVFRYQPNAPPKLPARILQLEEKPTFRLFPKIFRVALAGIAGLAVAFIAWGFWLRVSNDKLAIVEDMSQPMVVPIKIIFPIAPKGVSETAFQPVDKRIIQTKSVSRQNTTNLVFNQKTSKVSATKEVKLTKEEKFAYDQLMLALSITGSKLKEVKDKANSVNETTATIKTIR